MESAKLKLDLLKILKYLKSYGHFADRYMNHDEDWVKEMNEAWDEAIKLLKGLINTKDL
jgi:hypothetical protein